MKNRTILKLVSALTGLLLGSSLVSMSFAYDFEAYNGSVAVYGTDTVAGYTTLLKSSNVGSGAQVTFKVEKPDHGVVELPASAGLDGLATLELFEFHTRQAGEYKVSAKMQGASNYGQVSVFEVLPGEVSEIASGVTPTEQVVRLGRDQGEVEVSLKDVFGNPIEGHMVELIPSRGTDEVSAGTGVSNGQGRVNFALDSADSGVSTYSVYDLTVNKVLFERAKVVYFSSSEDIFGDSKALIGHASGSSSGPVAYLAFEDFPSSVTASDSLTFAVTALDQSNQVVTDYEGTVQFSIVSGDPAVVSLPSDYTFVPQDLGSHEFSLASLFTTAGVYTLQVTDDSDVAVFGTVPVTVAANTGSISDLVNVKNPVPGTYSNNVQVVSGTATPGTSLVVYDNNAEIGTATADTSGNFMFTTGLLDDGTHEIYVAIVNDAGVITASSTTVSIMVDTTAPKIDKVEMSPMVSVSAGADVEVKVFTESGLAQSTLEVDGKVYEMEDSEAGYYSSTVKAPMMQGSFPLKITLVDILGNNFVVSDEAVLTVGSGAALGTGLIGDVSGVVAYPGDHKVTLSWIPPTSGGPVQFYRIYYGLSSNQLQYAVDTWDASTTWYIPDLKNNTEYFFAVAAVDNYGNTSAHMSNIVSSIPGTVVDTNILPPDVWAGTAGGEQLQQMDSDVSDTGPEVLWIFLSAILGGIFYAWGSKPSESGLEA
jgi:hypothetical protein